MRVISQDGTIDIPYENSSLSVFCVEYAEPKCTIICCRTFSLKEEEKIAKYSNIKKALKAMEMLREQYARIEIIKALASGTCKHMEESLEPKEFKDILKKYINMEVFQFPQDDEIEV